MNKEQFDFFKKTYLSSFKKIYQRAKKYQRSGLKESVFDNPKLSEKQKEEFWEMVTEKDNK